MQLMHGDCLDVLRGMADNSIDSIVTDPPYGLSFMGKKWDYDVPAVEVWAECLRVLKPGGHLLAFAGTRTQHRMAVRIEDAGFEIRDMIAWIYGSGFPKSLAVDKALDGVLGKQSGGFNTAGGKENFDKQDKSFRSDYGYKYTPATEAAHQWQGWGTALKPALEPITMARKPLVGTVAANVLEHGTGALNIDGCRVEGEPWKAHSATGLGSVKFFSEGDTPVVEKSPHDGGRWPANLIHDGSDEVVAGFPVTGPSKASMRGVGLTGDDAKVYGKGDPEFNTSRGHNDNGGSAARFFYCAKASKADREEGLDGAPDRVLAMSNQAKAELARGNMHEGESGMNTAKVRKNHHPTVKPSDLMAYLCRLVTPPGGIVLDPFMGSGSTGKAAMREGFDFIGIEKDAGYFAIAQRRIEQAQQQLFAGVAA